MNAIGHTSRRAFVKTAAAAGAAVSSLGIASFARGSAPSKRVNVGLIGAGIRGYELHRSLKDISGIRLAGVVDLSDHYFERLGPELQDPQTPMGRDYRKLLDDPSVDAVIIASPDHWHAQMTLDALDAGKHVYVEKPLAYCLEEAVKVRDKARQAGRIGQVGYQRRSQDHFYAAREIIRSGLLGEITQIHLWSSRNRPTSPWRTYNDYNTPGLPKKSGPEHVDWERFQANRPPCPYDAKRFFHWQCYDEYSTGIFGILMSHPLDAANLLLDLDIPPHCCAAAGIYKYDDGRTVPDTCNALFNYPARKLIISFIGSSNNAFFDQEAHYRGTQGVMELGTSGLRVYAEGDNALFQKYVPREKAGDFKDLRRTPVYEQRAARGSSTVAHLDGFFQSIRGESKCKAPIEDCFKAMTAIAMAIQSHQSGRSVRWDAAQERIVQ